MTEIYDEAEVPPLFRSVTVPGRLPDREAWAKAGRWLWLSGSQWGRQAQGRVRRPAGLD